MAPKRKTTKTTTAKASTKKTAKTTTKKAKTVKTTVYTADVIKEAYETTSYGEEVEQILCVARLGSLFDLDKSMLN